jgi:hypothetical protein
MRLATSPPTRATSPPSMTTADRRPAVSVASFAETAEAFKLSDAGVPEELDHRFGAGFRRVLEEEMPNPLEHHQL